MEGKELKNWRAKHNLTQMELAHYLRVDRVTVTRWEIGLRKMPPFLHLALETIAKKHKRKGG
jgi:DNA-binding transcriptional regulator YiaG